MPICIQDLCYGLTVSYRNKIQGLVKFHVDKGNFLSYRLDRRMAKKCQKRKNKSSKLPRKSKLLSKTSKEPKNNQIKNNKPIILKRTIIKKQITPEKILVNSFNPAKPTKQNLTSKRFSSREVENLMNDSYQSIGQKKLEDPSSLNKEIRNTRFSSKEKAKEEKAPLKVYQFEQFKNVEIGKSQQIENNSKDFLIQQRKEQKPLDPDSNSGYPIEKNAQTQQMTEKNEQVYKNLTSSSLDPESNPRYKNFISKKSFFKKKIIQKPEEKSIQENKLQSSPSQKEISSIFSKNQTKGAGDVYHKPSIKLGNRAHSNQPIMTKLMKQNRQSNIIQEQSSVNEDEDDKPSFPPRNINLKIDSKVIVQSIYIRVINVGQNQITRNNLDFQKSYCKKNSKKTIKEYYESDDQEHYYRKEKKTKKRDGQGRFIQRYKEVLIEQSSSNSNVEDKQSFIFTLKKEKLRQTKKLEDISSKKENPTVIGLSPTEKFYREDNSTQLKKNQASHQPK